MRHSEQIKQELNEDEELHLEKHDMFALSLSGFLMIGLPCLVLILIIVGVTVLLFG